MFLQLEFFLLVRFCRTYSFTTYIASCLVSLYLESLIVLSSQVECQARWSVSIKSIALFLGIPYLQC